MPGTESTCTGRVVAEVIEFPASETAPVALPRSGDRYRAYGCWAESEPPSIAFVFPGWSIAALSYSRLRGHRSRPLGDPWDCDGDCEIVLTFGDEQRDAAEVVVIGRNLYPLVWDLGELRVSWIWELPEGRPAGADGSPVVRSIELRHGPAASRASPRGNAVRTQNANFWKCLCPIIRLIRPSVLSSRRDSASCPGSP